jgi:hypothetical protein
MKDQDQTGPGWTVVLRRQPARIVEGHYRGPTSTGPGPPGTKVRSASARWGTSMSLS